MSLPIKLPVTAKPTITSNIFTATWNVPTVNKYDFNVAGNQNQIIHTMNEYSVYVIERCCFSMSIPEGVFQESIDSATTIPQILFTTSKTGQNLFANPQPFINYVDNLELLKFVPCNQLNDSILATLQCVLDQVPATVGIVIIRCFLQLNIYEVQTSDWTRRFYHSIEEARGDLELRGNSPAVMDKVLELGKSMFS